MCLSLRAAAARSPLYCCLWRPALSGTPRETGQALARTAVQRTPEGLARQGAGVLAGLGANGIRVEDGDVGCLAAGKAAAVMQVVHQGRLARHAVDRIFQRHDLLFSHPVAQQAGTVVGTVALVWPCPAVGGANDRVRGAQDAPLCLRVIIAVDYLK